MKIEKITEEEEAAIPALVDQWVKSAETESTFDDIRSAVDRMYELMGHKKPLLLIAQSPLAAVHSAAALKIISGDEKLKTLDSTLRSTLGSTLGSTLRSTLDSTLYSTLDSTLRSTLDSTLYSTLGSTLDSTLYSTLDSTLRSTLRSTLDSTLYSTLYSTLGSTLDSTLRSTEDEKIKESIRWSYGGSYVVTWWGFWAGYYELGKSIGVKFDEDKYRLFTDFVRAVPYIVVLENIAIVSKKPTQIHWQETTPEAGWGNGVKTMPKNRRLHSEKEMAVQFEDGFGVYCLWNVRFEKELFENITSRKITAKEVLKIENMERRMAALKFLGAETLLNDLQAKPIDKSKRGNELYCIDKVFPSKQYCLKYSCPSTGRVYVSFVDPKVGAEKDADRAMAWKFSLTKEQYLSIGAES
jgi:hypothetical protein